MVSGTIALRLLAGASLACWCAPAQEAGAGEPIRVNVRLVHVIATVKDAAGALVGSLDKGDFVVKLCSGRGGRTTRSVVRASITRWCSSTRFPGTWELWSFRWAH